MKPLLMTLLLSLASPVFANGDFSFHGFLVTPPVCVISNDETIEIAFPTMQITDVNGSNFMREIPYTIDCDSTIRDEYMTMTLTLIGTASDFNDAAIATNANGFAIKILQDDQPFPIGTALTIDSQTKPVLKAVPIKSDDVTPPAGDFEAWATLQVEYQ